jgi:hypothetical protein
MGVCEPVVLGAQKCYRSSGLLVTSFAGRHLAMLTKRTETKAATLHEGFLTVVVLVVVAGSLALAVIDPNSRPAFIDLAKVIVAGYLGWMVPK